MATRALMRRCGYRASALAPTRRDSLFRGGEFDHEGNPVLERDAAQVGGAVFGHYRVDVAPQRRDGFDGRTGGYFSAAPLPPRSVLPSTNDSSPKPTQPGRTSHGFAGGSP